MVECNWLSTIYFRDNCFRIYNADASNTPLFHSEYSRQTKFVLIYPRCQAYVQASLRSTGANVESRGPIHNPSRETPAGNWGELAGMFAESNSIMPHH